MTRVYWHEGKCYGHSRSRMWGWRSATTLANISVVSGQTSVAYGLRPRYPLQIAINWHHALLPTGKMGGQAAN